MSKRSKSLHNALKKHVYNDPEAYAEYQAFNLQLELAEQMKKARERMDLTQEDVAEMMHTKKQAISRLESATDEHKNSPSLKTLIKYAVAIGYKLQIKFVPEKHKI
jgi:DNA-binding XRE family transcriptional regulator